MMKKITVSALLISLLSSCGSDEVVIDKSNRKSALSGTANLTSEFYSKGEKVSVPQAMVNKEWRNNNFRPVENIALNLKGDDYDTFGSDADPKRGYKITAQPIIYGGVVYTLNGEGKIEARDTDNIKKTIWENVVEGPDADKESQVSWTKKIKNYFRDTREFLGGNIAAGGGKIVVSTRRGNIFVFDSKTGDKIWQVALKIPVKSSPVIDENRVYVVTSTNSLLALDSKTGKLSWQHSGLDEKTQIFGSVTPILHDSQVVVIYSSGEIYALNRSTGEVAWTELLASNGSFSKSALSLSDVYASPILHRGKVYSTTSNGDFIAFDFFTGEKSWEVPINISDTPWAAGNYIFALTRKNELAAINANSGKIAWLKNALAEDEKFDEGTIFDTKEAKLYGPIVANGKIYVVSDKGRVREFEPATGDVAKDIKIPSDVRLSPVTANGNLYLFDSESNLVLVK
jgi:outer membrane protein assembly factor BamB